MLFNTDICYKEKKMYLFNMHLNKAILIFIFLLSGCSTSNLPFHSKEPSANNCEDSSIKKCYESYYQRHPEYDIAFAEFTERGNSFNPLWINNILQTIELHEKDTGVVIVVFVHGWKHNADEADGNLNNFKKALLAIASSQNSPLNGRKLIGLYIGWRGLSIDIPGIKNISYWDRKAVAEEVGKGGVTKLLLALESIDKKNDNNVLVTVGHSFGGAIVVSAVSDILIERTINKETIKSIGDTIIVINPAIEANQILPLIESAITTNYSDDQSPLFISISSDADSATHYAFPLGQSINLLLSWRQADLQRDYYHDRLGDNDSMLKEEHLDTTTIGNFAPYLTHHLSSTTIEGSVPTLNLNSCKKKADECVPKGLTTLSGHPTFSPLPDNYPFYFIKTDDSMMRDHNDIFNDTMRTFMITLIDDIIRSNINKNNRLSSETNSKKNQFIINNPNKLNTIFQRIYPKDKVSNQSND